MVFESLKQQLIKILYAYTSSSTFHCIKYIGMTKLNILERIFWFIAFLLFLLLSCNVSFYLWEKFDQKPTIVKIEDTHLAFNDVSFPAVTICPANRVKKSLALDYLNRFLNHTIINREKILVHVMSALSLLQYPTYTYMGYHLKEANKYLPLFDSLNITDFMIKTLPSCSEIMKRCYWHGKEKNCCHIFALQRTEEGFCYSFNSMLSERRNNCPPYTPSIMLREDKQLTIGKECVPWFTFSSGAYSGLTVTMKGDNIENGIGNNGTKYEKGTVVMISTTYELPEAGTGRILETNPGEILQLEVTPVVMGSSRKLSNIDQKDRNCRLQNENNLSIYELYTQSSCLIECRQKFLGVKCKCQLYFFYDKLREYPPCTLNQLKCIANLNSSRTYKDLSGSNLKRPDCNCILPCYGTIYETIVRRNSMSVVNSPLFESSVLDVYYTSQGGIRYSKRISFTESQLTVSIGNVGNLFLGCSIISILEIVYYIIRALIVSMAQ